MIGALAVLGAGAGLAAGIRTLANFSQEMSTVAAIAQTTEREFKSLNDTAIALGTNTRFSATQAAEGMTFLARAGFDATEVLETIDDTLNLAQAGALDLGTAADIASNALTAFRLETDQAGRVVDVLALAANSSNTNVQQLGDGLKLVAPIAAGVGVEIEEVTGAIAALSNAGLQATLAGTGLRRVISELESPSSKTQRQLAALGLSTADYRVSAVGLTTALQALAAAGVDTGLGLEIFGDRGGPAFEVLSTSIGDVIKFTEALQNADGTAQRIAATMDDNLNGAILQTKSALEGFILTIGESGANGALRSFFEALTNGLRFLTANIEGVTRVATFLAALFATGLGIRVVVGALNLLRVALLSNPVTFLPTILLSAVAAAFTFRKEIANLEVAGVRVGDALGAAFDVIGERVSFVAERIRSFLPAAAQVGAGLIDIFRTSFEGVLGFAEQFFNAFLPAFESVFGATDGAGAIVKRFANTAIAIFVTVGDVFQGVIDNIVTGFANLATFDFSEPFESLKRIARQQFLDTAGIINDTLRTSQRNFEMDYVGGFADIATAGALALTEGFDGQSGTEALSAFLDVGGDINERIAERKAMRFAEAFRTGVMAILGTFNSSDLLPDAPTAPQLPGGLGETTGPADLFSTGARDALSAINAPATEFMDTQAALSELLDANAISAEEYAIALNEATVASNRLGTDVGAGLAAGLAQARLNFTDLSGAASDLVVNGFNAAEDALVSFITTGEADFSAFIDGLLADLARLIAKQALLAVFGGDGGGGGGGGLVGSLFGAFEQRQNGGPVAAGQTVITGEDGMELFTPRTAGNITPAGETAAILRGGGMPTPIVNVAPPVTNIRNVVEGEDEGEREGEILNVIRRNRRTIGSTIA